MKNSFRLFIVTLLLSIPGFLFATVVLGSGVSIPVLNSVNVYTLFNVNNGVITEDIVIRGNLEVDALNNITFSAITISGYSQSTTYLTFTECYLLFSSCDIEDGNTMNLDDSYIRFSGTEINNWYEVTLANDSRADCGAISKFNGVDLLNVETRSILNAHSTEFMYAPISANGNTTVVMQKCGFYSNSPAAISLVGSGYYYGWKNEFAINQLSVFCMNPGDDFIYVHEVGSLFLDNSEPPFALNGASEIILSGNRIITEDDHTDFEWGIAINGGNGITSISNNTISGLGMATYGIFMRGRQHAYIANNTITELNGGVGMRLDFIDNLNVASNDVLDNSNSRGIVITGSPGATITGNQIVDHTINLEILSSDNCTIENNDCENATDAGILLTNTQRATLCDNTVESGEDGIRLSSTNMLLEMADNHFISNERGLVYMQDVLTNAQIEKGNDFTTNTLGAEFEDVTEPFAIAAMRYEVRNISAEYPSHQPDDWFLPIGSASLQCNIAVASMPDIEHMICCIEDAPIDGKCPNDVMLALEIIEEEGLEDEESIEEFLEVYSGGGLDLLPTIRNVSAYLEPFDESTPVIGIDTFGVLSNLSAHLEYLEDMQVEYESVKSAQATAVSALISTVEGLTLANSYEEDYQFAILGLLNLIMGSTLTSGDSSDIINLAEGCIVDDGPGIYVAQIIAGWLDLEYVRATGCTPVTQRSPWDKTKQRVSGLTVFPNPVYDLMTLSHSVDEEHLRIYDAMGKLVSQVDVFSGKIVDVSELRPGIYCLHVHGSDSRLKFIKA